MKVTKALPIISIVVPCYYEEAAIPHTAEVLGRLVQSMVEAREISADSHVCFVNDGSLDGTWPAILNLIEGSPLYRGVNLSRNFGHQSALLAGLFTDKADAYVSIDADLQDDETKIREMVRLFLEGKDIVYGCRDDRSSDTWFKRTTAVLFYRLRSLLGCQTIPNHADFRLMSLRAVNELRRFGEVNLFLRGIVPMLGFSSAKVFYARKSRMQGETKYPLVKMLKFAWEGVVNFSEFPLFLCLLLGILVFCSSLILMGYCFVQWKMGETLPGWTSTVLIISTFSGLQFLFMGVIGLYIGKIFRETKNRPLYIVQDDMT